MIVQPAAPTSSAAPAAPAPVRVALVGCGTVGTQVVRLLRQHSAEIAERVGAPVELVGIAVRSLAADRGPDVPADLLTTDAQSLVRGADVVVELIGGTTTARELVLDAIAHGAGVVTANKALLATHGPQLHAAADAAGVDLLYEAAVAGAVPVVRGVRESLAGDRVERVLGIVNGTTNFILDEMTTGGHDFDVVLARAQELGYAEADPTADIEGHDAAAKAAILASLAFHTRVSLDDVECEGIAGVTAADIAAARDAGGVIKLLAIAERIAVGDDPAADAVAAHAVDDDDAAHADDAAAAKAAGAAKGAGGATGEAVAVRVHPVILPGDHPLAGVHGAYNAVVVEAEAAGRLMFYGAGAGGTPTASAVLGDLVAAARHRSQGGRAPAESAYAQLPVAGPELVISRRQVRLVVEDRPGVLAHLAATFAAHGVSIETVRQQAGDGEAATLAIVTHDAPESALRATIEALRETTGVREFLSAYRVERARPAR